MLWIYAASLLLTFFYALTSAMLFIGVSRTRKSIRKNEAQDPVDIPFVSVLVAARNEEKHIAGCLESLVKQDYPSDRYEIVIVNDRSTDKTPEIVGKYQRKYGLVKRVDVESNPSGLTGKQNALNEGLNLCTGEIILNTDADCIAGPLWISRMVSRFTPQIGLVMGFSTTYRTDDSRAIFASLQSLDMLLLMDSAAGAIGVNVPTSGLGRNLAYRRSVLNDIDYLRMGYTITEDAALIRAIAKDTNWRISIAYDKDASVSTAAEKNVKQLLSQRTRWLIGGRETKLWSQIPLHGIFVFNLYLALSFFVMFFVNSFIAITLLAAFTKIILDFVRCFRVCRIFGRTDLLKLFLPYEIYMIFYSILTVFGSIFIRKVRWKGEICMRSTRHQHSI